MHSDVTVGCRECPKKYKTVYSRTRLKKKHHPAPHSAARVDHRSMSTARALGPTRSERQPTAREPGNTSREELAQCQKGEIAGSRRNALQLSRSQNNTPDGSAVRQDGTSEWPRRAGDSTRDVGNKGEEKPQVEGEGVAQGDLNPGSAGCAKTGAGYSGVSPYPRVADYSQPPPPQDPDTEEDDEVQCIVNTTKIRKLSTLKA